MMGGRTFGLLKTGRLQPKSTKRAEIRLAILLKVLYFAGSAGKIRCIRRQVRLLVAEREGSAGYG